ncbi:hypothetical protein N9392_00290 [Flavobacteriaceae bacterium]|nr:hypothetical protein [Flavobacteriaceae bacterium]
MKVLMLLYPLAQNQPAIIFVISLGILLLIMFFLKKSKTPEKKISEQPNEKTSVMQSMILSSPHDDSMKDENPDGIGEFGLEKTNPIPVNGVDNVDAYMDKIRYGYTSKNGKNTFFYKISHIRTSDSDDTPIGSEKPMIDLVQSSATCNNIKGRIDTYNLYSLKGKKLAKIYINSYSLKTSNKIPKGFISSDNIPKNASSKSKNKPKDYEKKYEKALGKEFLSIESMVNEYKFVKSCYSRMLKGEKFTEEEFAQIIIKHHLKFNSKTLSGKLGTYQTISQLTGQWINGIEEEDKIKFWGTESFEQYNSISQIIYNVLTTEMMSRAVKGEKFE